MTPVASWKVIHFYSHRDCSLTVHILELPYIKLIRHCAWARYTMHKLPGLARPYITHIKLTLKFCFTRFTCIASLITTVLSSDGIVVRSSLSCCKVMTLGWAVDNNSSIIFCVTDDIFKVTLQSRWWCNLPHQSEVPLGFTDTFNCGLIHWQIFNTNIWWTCRGPRKEMIAS